MARLYRDARPASAANIVNCETLRRANNINGLPVSYYSLRIIA